MKQKTVKLPKITFILLTYNGGKGVKRCLESIKNQDYPRQLIDIVVVDDRSSDDSILIAKKYTKRVFISGKHDMYLSWAIGLHKAKGEFVYLVEQDIELRDQSFLKKMITPLIDDPKLAASFTRSYPKKEQNWVTRFISYHPAQCDPLYEYLTPNVEQSFIKNMPGYIQCKFVLGKIPPDARMFFRISFLKKTSIWKMKRCFDHDLVVKLVRASYNKIAYVPSAGIYHNHADSLSHLLKKRVRNLTAHYFPYQDTLEYRWIDLNNKKDLFKLLVWVIYANLFFPALVRGIYRAFINRDWVLIVEPIIAITTTDVIIWTFLSSQTGRKLAINGLISIFGKQIPSKGAFGQ